MDTDKDTPGEVIMIQLMQLEKNVWPPSKQLLTSLLILNRDILQITVCHGHFGLRSFLIFLDFVFLSLCLLLTGLMIGCIWQI